jgi:hypothetical protein
VADEVEWRTDELKIFAKSLGHDKDGRALKLQMQNQFDSITETLRDRLRHGVGTLTGAGSYPADLAESVEFKTKIVGGKNARVSIVGEGRTRQGKWREVGKLLDDGYLFHPAWGHWRGSPPPNSLRQDVPSGPRMVTDALDRSEPVLRDEIRAVLTDYLDRLTDIRKAMV